MDFESLTLPCVHQKSNIITHYMFVRSPVNGYGSPMSLIQVSVMTSQKQSEIRI